MDVNLYPAGELERLIKEERARLELMMVEAHPKPVDPAELGGRAGRAARRAERAVGRTPQEVENLMRNLIERRVERGLPSYADEEEMQKLGDGWMEECIDGDGNMTFTLRVPTSLPSGVALPLCRDAGFAALDQCTSLVRRAETNSRAAFVRRLRHEPPAEEHGGDEDEDEEYHYNMNYHNNNDVPQAEAEADEFEIQERDPRMRETRQILREDWRLSANTKTVLLLVTQIPKGCWTNITTLQKHIARHMKTRRGLRALASNPTLIEKALAENWLGNDRVPCHRVVGGFCYPTIWVAGHVHDPELLLVEGVRLGAGQIPLGKPWDDFSGCPKATKVLLVRN